MRALAVGDRATAERLAHSSKGVSGNIGATGLQELAGTLEKQIHDGAPTEALDAALTPFSKALEELVRHLRQALPEEPSAAPAVSVDPGKLKETVARLAALLSNDDSEAVEVLEENRDLLQTGLGVDLFHKVDQAAKQYDFEKAHELLANRPSAGVGP